MPRTYSDWVQEDDYTVMMPGFYVPAADASVSDSWTQYIEEDEVGPDTRYDQAHFDSYMARLQSGENDRLEIGDSQENVTILIFGQYRSPANGFPLPTSTYWYAQRGRFAYGASCHAKGAFSPTEGGPLHAVDFQWQSDNSVGGLKQSAAMAVALADYPEAGSDPLATFGDGYPLRFVQFNYAYSTTPPYATRAVGGSWVDRMRAHKDPSHFTYTIETNPFSNWYGKRRYKLIGGPSEYADDAFNEVFYELEPITAGDPNSAAIVNYSEIDLTDYLHGDPEEGFVCITGETEVADFPSGSTGVVQIGGYLQPYPWFRYTLRPPVYRWVIHESPTIDTTSLPDGLQNTPYSFNLSRTADSGSWYLYSGVPPGLSVNPATGVLSGIPTEPGVYNLYIQFFEDTTSLAAYVILPLTIAPQVGHIEGTQNVNRARFGGRAGGMG